MNSLHFEHFKRDFSVNLTEMVRPSLLGASAPAFDLALSTAEVK